MQATIHLPEIDSTQLYAKRWLDKHPNASWTSITADNQTQGHGQWGRPWISLPGNLHVTYIIPIAANPMMGLRMVEIIYHALKEEPIQVKWPNDIFLNGKKCGGVLCEAYSNHTLIGVGLNIAKAPEGRSCITTNITRNDISQTLAQHLMHWDMTSKRPWELPPLMYQSTWIDYTSPQGNVTNIYVEGLSDDGALIAKGENGDAMVLHSGRLGLAGERT